MEEVFQDQPGTHKEEKAFLELFEQAMWLINQDRLCDQDIENGIQSAIDNFRYGPSNACAIENFESLANLCGYFYYFSPLSAGLTRHRTLIALSECVEFRSCFQRPALKLVSLGGGTGSDLVGLFSAISENFDFRRIELKIVDNNYRFESFFQVVENLLRKGGFGNASLFLKSKRINTSFICADLTNPMSTQCVKSLEDADIVWMKGFISVLKYDSERYRATESIISHMPEGAFLVVIDSPSYFQYIHLDDMELIFPSHFGPYTIKLPYEPQFNISRQSNQEICIYKKIKQRDSE